MVKRAKMEYAISSSASFCSSPKVSIKCKRPSCRDRRISVRRALLQLARALKERDEIAKFVKELKAENTKLHARLGEIGKETLEQPGKKPKCSSKR